MASTGVSACAASAATDVVECDPASMRASASMSRIPFRYAAEVLQRTIGTSLTPVPLGLVVALSPDSSVRASASRIVLRVALFR